MIKLKDGYFITSDKWNVILKREVPVGRNPFGTETKNLTKIVDIGYHVNLGNALCQYLDERIKAKIKNEDIDVQELRDLLEILKKEIREITI